MAPISWRNSITNSQALLCRSVFQFQRKSEPEGRESLAANGTKAFEMVEAAGIEPASEKARSEKTTCVSDSVVSSIPLRTGKKENGLVRLSFGCAAPDRSFATYPPR